MSKFRKKFIEETVQEIRNTIPSAFNLPVNLKKVLSSLDIELVKNKDLESSISGFGVVDGRNKGIAVNGNQSTVRQRFTIAHELGHIFIHHDKSFTVQKGPTTYFRSDLDLEERWREREANYFAACVLMPEDLVFEKFDEFSNEFSTEEEVIYELKKAFKVSEPAICIRLSQLGLIDF